MALEILTRKTCMEGEGGNRNDKGGITIVQKRQAVH